jgi:two-component system LytT family response regulator
MKAILVDDEADSHIALKSLLERRHPEVEILASGYNVKEGVQLVQQHKPDLLFLDIEMPDGSGFDLLEQIQSPSFNLIFVTAFNQYAQTAIRFGALDYLSKPVDPIELSAAILKAQVKRIEQIQLFQLEIMRETLAKLEKKELPQRMSISTAQGILYFPTADIIRLEAMQNFTEFKVAEESRRLIASNNLKRYEIDLRPYPTFMRVHRSHIVNLLQINRFTKGDKAYLEMADASIVPVSLKYKEELVRRMEELSI